MGHMCGQHAFVYVRGNLYAIKENIYSFRDLKISQRFSDFRGKLTQLFSDLCHLVSSSRLQRLVGGSRTS